MPARGIVFYTCFVLHCTDRENADLIALRIILSNLWEGL